MHGETPVQRCCRVRQRHTFCPSSLHCMREWSADAAAACSARRGVWRRARAGAAACAAGAPLDLRKRKHSLHRRFPEDETRDDRYRPIVTNCKLDTGKRRRPSAYTRNVRGEATGSSRHTRRENDLSSIQSGDGAHPDLASVLRQPCCRSVGRLSPLPLPRPPCLSLPP